MNSIGRTLIVAVTVLFALPLLQALLTGAGISDELVLAYAILLPLLFMLAAFAGIVIVSFRDLLRRFPIVPSFGWRPGRAHITGEGGKKKRSWLARGLTARPEPDRRVARGARLV